MGADLTDTAIERAAAAAKHGRPGVTPLRAVEFDARSGSHRRSAGGEEVAGLVVTEARLWPPAGHQFGPNRAQRRRDARAGR